MRKLCLFLFGSLLTLFSNAQLLAWTPEFIVDQDAGAITITLDANFGNKGLLGYTPSDVFAHTGVITNLSTSSSNWRYVKFNQNFTLPNPSLQATSLGNNRWSFTITNLRAYYGVPAGEQIKQIAILFRSGDGTKVQRNADGSDMYIPVIQTGTFNARITQPYKQPTFVPRAEPVFKAVGDVVNITAQASTSATITIRFNGNTVNTQTGVTTLSGNATITAAGTQLVTMECVNGGTTLRDTVEFYVAAPTQVQELPVGVRDGINYSADGTQATLVLFAPQKNNVVVIGDFSDWKQQLPYQMKRTGDGNRYWVTINGLTPGQEYGYQFVIDGNLKVGDYYAEKVLDPWNDPYINEAPYTDKYPNLKPYPSGKTTGVVSVLQPGKPAFNWNVTNFQRADKRNIIVYEMLLRDFLKRNDWKTLTDTLSYISRLGVNVIHVMPFTEFEGNNSWGYNPAYMFSADKYYGPEEDLKRFIDACHARGMAVILDMVLNHQFGSSPMVQMYWDAVNNKPATNNPWVNPDARHPFNVGYDLNHEADPTKYFVQRVMEHWLTKFKLDGFRWDLSKGFTQLNNPNNLSAWSAYDQSRVDIWQRIYDQSQAISPGCYMILEHLGADSEERELAYRGLILWGKMTDEFNQNSMGYNAGSDFSRAYHKTRWTVFGAAPPPHLMAYAESHDEERLAYKNVRYGNTANALHNTKTTSVYANRLQSVAAFLFTIPGPKLMWQFGELAYDSSINMCENFTIGDCRTAPKPPAWNMPGGNYNTVSSRLALRNMVSKIIQLRTRNTDYFPTWYSEDYEFSLGDNYQKWQWVKSASLGVATAGNFDVYNQNTNIKLPTAGTWYLFASNWASAPTTLSAPSANTIITNTSQPAGTFVIYTDRVVDLKLPKEYIFTGIGNWSTASNWLGGLVPPLVLPAGDKIIINNAAGECLLDVNQTIAPGGTLQVNAGKTLRITGNLIRL